MFLIMSPSLPEPENGQGLAGGHPETGIKLVVKRHADIPPERRGIHHHLASLFKIFCFHISCHFMLQNWRIPYEYPSAQVQKHRNFRHIFLFFMIISFS